MGCNVCRREAIKEALRQKLELERKALQVVERLLEDSVTEEFLIDCVSHITYCNCPLYSSAGDLNGCLLCFKENVLLSIGMAYHSCQLQRHSGRKGHC